MNRVLIGLALGLTVATSAVAQRGAPGDRPQRPRQQQQRQQRQMERAPGQRAERLKGMLEARLERLREQESKLQDALSKLESGHRPEIEPWMLEPMGGANGQQQRPQARQRGEDAQDGPLGALGGPRVGGERDRLGQQRRGEGGARAQHGDGHSDQPFDREKAMDFLQENNPRLFQRLQRLAERDPEAAERLLRARSGRFRELMHEREQDPEAFTLRQEAFEAQEAARAAARAAKANPDDPEARAHLREVLEQGFDLRHKIQQAAHDRMTKQLAEAKKRLEKQNREREAMIDKHIGELLEGASGASQRGSDSPRR